MNELKIFNDERFGQLRSTVIDGAPWFVAIDVCKSLELSDTGRATERLEPDELTRIKIESGGQTREVIAVNEPGLYSLVMGSRKPEAKLFKRWVTHEVIPSIRKYGLYATENTVENILQNPDVFIELMQRYKAEREANAKLTTKISMQNQMIAEMQPKVTYYEVVLSCPDPLSISEIAKDYGRSGKWLNSYLKEKKIQYKVGKKQKTWLLYQKYADKGYTKSVTALVPDSYGEQHARLHTYWTQKGRLFIYDTLKADGILPIVEQNVDIDDIF